MRLEAIFFYLSSVIFGSGICKYPQVGISFSVTGRIMGKPSFVLIHLIQPNYALHMCRYYYRNTFYQPRCCHVNTIRQSYVVLLHFFFVV